MRYVFGSGFADEMEKLAVFRAALRQPASVAAVQGKRAEQMRRSGVSIFRGPLPDHISRRGVAPHAVPEPGAMLNDIHYSFPTLPDDTTKWNYEHLMGRLREQGPR